MMLVRCSRWRPKATTLGVLTLVAAWGLMVTGCQPRASAGQDGSSWGHRTSTTGPTAGSQRGALQGTVIVALGDSFSAGEGDAPYDPNAPGCDRGSDAWPRVLGQRITGSTVTLLACSGASTSAFTQSFHNQPAQLTALRSLVATGVKPSVVTITIGGNDASFGSTLLSCVVFRCFWTGDDSTLVHFVDDTLPGRLSSVYSQVKAAVPGARVVVVGYPDLVPTWGEKNTCGWLNTTNRSQLSSLNSDINRAARRAARTADVGFVSLDRALKGHELCTSDSWLYPVGIHLSGTDGSAHPNAQGRQAMADTVYSYLSQRS